MNNPKAIFTRDKLISAGAELVCSFMKKDVIINADMERPGFYFIVKHKTGELLTRYYSGNQRKHIPASRIGFWKVYYRILEQKSSVDVELADKGWLESYYLPVEKVEELLGIKRPGPISRIRDTARYYSLHELNSLLFDNIEFPLQKK